MLTELVGGQLDRITAATVYEACVLNDPYANEVMAETAKILGAGRQHHQRAEPRGDRDLRRRRRARASTCSRRCARRCAGARSGPPTTPAASCPRALPETAGMIGAAAVFKKTVFGTV
jgi:hypothetical protein